LGDVSATVYLADANTPLEFADPNIPFVYRDIMIGTKLTIIISSDANDFWSGRFEINFPDLYYGFLSARDFKDATLNYESSVLEAAGDRANVSEHKDSEKTTIDLITDSYPLSGDWFIIDYTATTIGTCAISFYEYSYEAEEYHNDENPPDPIDNKINNLVFSHVPSRDFNRDAKVDFTDFAIISAFKGMTDCTGTIWCEETDLDFDGDVDNDDLILFADYWLERME
jgi:hypothetical protein